MVLFDEDPVTVGFITTLHAITMFTNTSLPAHLRNNKPIPHRARQGQSLTHLLLALCPRVQPALAPRRATKRPQISLAPPQQPTLAARVRRKQTRCRQARERDPGIGRREVQSCQECI